MSVSLSTAYQVSAAVAYVDAAGNPPASPPVNPTFSWSIDDPSIATVVGTGASAEITPLTAGTCNLSVTDGTFTATAAITVTADVATGLVVTFGTPTLKAMPTT